MPEGKARMVENHARNRMALKPGREPAAADRRRRLVGGGVYGL